MTSFPIIERLCERLVKPSTSTPPSLRWYKLSFNDQIQKPVSAPLVFFYPNQGCDSTTITETSQFLETALSKTLSYYYPFAGRLKDNNLSVECNDKGVHFSVARIKCSITQFTKQHNSQREGLVSPSVLYSLVDRGDGSLLQVQLNYFDCGGMAVTLCMSHKLGDLPSLFTFIQDWAAMVRESNHIPSPKFIGASLFPPTDDPSLIKELNMKPLLNPAKYLLFRGHKLAELKDMVANTSDVKNPSRVEVLAALLYKCALDSSKEVSGSFKPAALSLAMNLRPITVPPLPKEAIGNINVSVLILTLKEEEITLQELVSKIRNAKVDIKNQYKESKADASDLSVKLAMARMTQGVGSNFDRYICTSWCGFPFYDVDFGRGKPEWVYVQDHGGPKNAFSLRDVKGQDAIQVMAMLEEPQMSAFLTNKNLLAFASLTT